MVRAAVITVLVCIFSIFFQGNGVAKEKLSVFVSIVPQKYFLQQICKNLVNVQVMIHTGANPHTYEPKPQQMVALSKAQLYFAVGIEVEGTILKKIAATNPNLKIVRTDHGIEKLAMVTGKHDHDDHAEQHLGNGHAHEKDKHHRETTEQAKNHREHTGLDPHIWLSPPLVKIQARTILKALQEVDPQHRNVYETNFNAFTAQIDQLDTDLKKTFKGKAGLRFLTFHPAWGYFAHAYGLKQVPIEIEGKSPKPARLSELVQYARESGIRVVFVQPQFSAKSAELIAREIKGQVAFADPLAEDWLANLREVANKFQAVLK